MRNTVLINEKFIFSAQSRLSLFYKCDTINRDWFNLIDDVEELLC